MKKKRRKLLLFLIPLMAAVLWSMWQDTPLKVTSGLSQLPRPIGQERVLITTAGQAVDGLLVSKIATTLNLKHDYRRKITGPELPGRFSTCVIVVGVSTTGLKHEERTSREEYQRIEGLLAGALEHQMPVVVLHIGGKERRNRSNDQYLELVIPRSQYLIVMGDGNEDSYLAQLAQGAGIPFSEVADFNGLRSAFNSVFR